MDLIVWLCDNSYNQVHENHKQEELSYQPNIKGKVNYIYAVPI